MIVANIELVSAVSKSRDKHQGRIEIGNIGGTAVKGNYRYRIFGKRGQLLHEGVLNGFPRKELLAIDLVALCLADARKDRLKKVILG